MYSNVAKMSSTRKITMIAVLSAIAYVVMVVGRIPVVMFLKYDPKDVIITIGGLIYGPLSAFIISLVVSFVEMITVSDTGPIGFIMNLLSSCAFACTAAVIYKRKKTIKSAMIGLVSGFLLATVAMLLWNYLITPLYMGYPREAVAAMLLPVFLPFNLLKWGINAALTMLLYKPLVKALRASNLIPTREEQEIRGESKKLTMGVLLVSAAILITCILVILVWQGVL